MGKPCDAADTCLGHNPSGRGTAGALLRRPRLPYSRYGCASPSRIASRIAAVAHVNNYEIGSTHSDESHDTRSGPRRTHAAADRRDTQTAAQGWRQTAGGVAD